MMNDNDYWYECLCNASDEMELGLSLPQLRELAKYVEDGHDSFGQFRYSPPSSDRITDIEDEYKAKLVRLQAEYDAYRNNAESAVKQALHVWDDVPITIGEYGEVMSHGGDTRRIQ